MLSRDNNDVLYSKIIRFGHLWCQRCRLPRGLDCAHIMPRERITTRFLLEPVRNAVALCRDCHQWFDTHKNTEILFNEDAQDRFMPESSYHWLVLEAGYTWTDLRRLYAISQDDFIGIENGTYSSARKDIGRELRKYLRFLEGGSA